MFCWLTQRSSRAESGTGTAIREHGSIPRFHFTNFPLRKYGKAGRGANDFQAGKNCAPISSTSAIRSTSGRQCE